MAVSTIQLNDRIAIFGMTGSGKSVLAHFLFKTIPSKLPTEEDPRAFWKICIDITDSVIEPNALTFYDPEAIPWDQSSALRFVPNVDFMEESVNALYENAFLHTNVWLWLDEANEVTTAHRVIPGLRRVLLQGRKFQVGGANVSPRPADINKSIKTQSHHWFVFTLLDPEDRRTVASNIGLTLVDFDATMSSLPPYGYLWFDVRKNTLYQMPPLPREIVDVLEGVA